MEWLTEDIPLDCRIIYKKKKDGGTRVICAPNEKLKTAQGHILRYLEKLAKENYKLRPTKYAHGCVPGRSTLTCAQMHAMDNSATLSFDILKFFDNCPTDHVWERFISCGLPAGIVDRIKELCTRDGRCPQGFPTSPWLTNLAMIGTDLMVASYAKRHNMTYSRYVDDMVLATTGSTPERGDGGKWPKMIDIERGIEKILSNIGLKLKRKKTHQMHRFGREKRRIIGVTIRQDGNGYDAPRKLRLKGRAIVHNLAKAIKEGSMDKSEMNALWVVAKGYVSYMDHLRRDNINGHNTADPFINEDDWGVCVGWFGG